jgi:hypothetical protein
MDWAYAQSVQIEPFGVDTNETQLMGMVAKYEWAKLTVTYGLPEYDLGGQSAYMTETINGSAEFLTLPAENFSWDAEQNEPLEVEEAPGYIRKMISWSITYHKVPYIPPTIWSFVGKVNSKSHSSPKYSIGFAEEELLYGAPSIDVENFPDGSRSMDVSLSLTWKPGGWNKLKRPGVDLVQPIYYGGSEWKRYVPVDLSEVVPG